jgi:hypothetical protein
MKHKGTLGFLLISVLVVSGCTLATQKPKSQLGVPATSQPNVGEGTFAMFEGTAYISPDVLTPLSPTDFVAITAQGRLVTRTFDRRANNWVEGEMYVFRASYECSFDVDVLVNPEFSESEAMDYATRFSRVLGQLPIGARSQVNELWIHAGDFPFGGGNQSILIHTDLAERDRAYIEELFIHESAHTSLDWQFGGLVRESDWQAVSGRDIGFVSRYAEEFPDREDVAESFGAYTLWLQAKGEPSLKADALRIEALIPQRLAFFDGLGKQLGLESVRCSG